MLFNSYGFIFVFLPLILMVFHAAPVSRARLATLLAASCAFYAAWDPAFLLLVLGSILVNYALGGMIARRVEAGRGVSAARVLGLGIAANLAVLALFKYSGFLLANIGLVAPFELPGADFILPLGISFYTFEQIAYLVDLGRGERHRQSLPEYALFVLFFPRLVAGPILRFGEVSPQFQALASRPRPEAAHDIAVGLTLFAIGLCKKALLADGIAPYVPASFALAEGGGRPDLLLAWGGALAYTAQLYFDFSGYSDMAIGLARCFGVRFPMNFDSPYKAGSIVSFWRRWHMTLSRFLRDYLYIPLGGNRRGPLRQRVNLMATMLLGGLWHGANWTFVIWGGLHGLYLIVNHLWSSRVSSRYGQGAPAFRVAGWLLTFLAVIVGWVFFRAPSLEAAFRMLAGMAGLHGVALPHGVLSLLGPAGAWLQAQGVAASGSAQTLVLGYAWALSLLGLACLAPNSQELLASAAPTLERVRDRASAWRWSLSPGWAAAAGVGAALGVLSLTREGEFLYWQF